MTEGHDNCEDKEKDDDVASSGMEEGGGGGEEISGVLTRGAVVDTRDCTCYLHTYSSIIWLLCVRYLAL